VEEIRRGLAISGFEPFGRLLLGFAWGRACVRTRGVSGVKQEAVVPTEPLYRLARVAICPRQRGANICTGRGKKRGAMRYR